VSFLFVICVVQMSFMGFAVANVLRQKSLATSRVEAAAAEANEEARKKTQVQQTLPETQDAEAKLEPAEPNENNVWLNFCT